MGTTRIWLYRGGLFPVFIVGLAVSGTTASFYVDSVAGSDSAAGTSSSTPWKTLSPVNSHSFVAGDVIQFKAGSTFTGGLTLGRSGVSGNPITYATYGTGNRPAFTNPSGNNVIPIRGSWNVLQGVLARRTWAPLSSGLPAARPPAM
jgi:hypothetical protein